MFTNTYLPHVGGVARSVKTFATDLRKKGNRVLIVAPVYPGYESEDRNQRDILRVPAVQEFNGSDFSVRIPVPFFMDESINDFDPQLIHSHHPYLLGDAALRIARRRKLPLLFTHHTLYEAYIHHVNVHSDALQQFAAKLSTQYANLCDRLISPSQSIAELIRSRGVESPVDVIPTGVDIRFFSTGDRGSFRRDHGIDDSDFVIGHLGRLAPEKNLEYLANVVSQTIKKRPEAVFLAAGDGSSKEQIQRTFKQQGLENHLVMPGSVTGPAIADAYHAMDLFVFSSQTETQGMVLTEAMAAGVPVVALDGPGVREVVAHEKNGLLLGKDATVEEFSDVLTGILKEPGMLDSWRSHARKTADKFSRETSADRLEQLYASMKDACIGPTDDCRHSLEPWEALLNGLQAEWDLVMQKAKTLVETLQE